MGGSLCGLAWLLASRRAPQAELELENLMLGDGQSRLQLAPNLTYLGRLGAVEIEGLVVAYVSGLYPPHSDKALTNSVAVGLSVALHSIRGVHRTREALREPAASQPRLAAMNKQNTRHEQTKHPP